MKKLILIPGLFLLFILFFPKQTLAQQWDNKFGCEWTGIQCVVKSSQFPNGCAPGFEANQSVCTSKNTAGSCNTTANQNCVLVATPSPSPGSTATPTRWSCQGSFGGCTVDPNGGYTDFEACRAACIGQVKPKFSCKSGRCVEDQNGIYDSISSCSSNCSATTTSGKKATCTPPGGKSGEGIETAIGCIPFGDTSTFAGFFIGWGIGIGGGIAFLLTLYAGFMIMTSSGNPERLKAGQELLTSALAGLIMIVFSVFLLRLIGVNILGIFK